MFQIKNKILFNLVLSFSVFALFAAYFIQYVLGHQPCNLCLFERVPYILTIIIIIISFIFNKYEKIYLALLSIIFISATLIHIKHLIYSDNFVNFQYIQAFYQQLNHRIYINF